MLLIGGGDPNNKEKFTILAQLNKINKKARFWFLSIVIWLWRVVAASLEASMEAQANLYFLGLFCSFSFASWVNSNTQIKVKKLSRGQEFKKMLKSGVGYLICLKSLMSR